MKIDYPQGATPLEREELEGLLLSIKTQGDLNRFEKQAIFECRFDLRKSRKIKKDILTLSGLKVLHRKMFAPVWSWAGEFRSTEKNIGIAPQEIQIQLQQLCENCLHRLSDLTADSWPEFAAFFHHALVSIHPFPNGNGRHARLATDLLSWRIKLPEPSWGQSDLTDANPERARYITALKRADCGDLKPLIQFMFT